MASQQKVYTQIVDRDVNFNLTNQSRSSKVTITQEQNNLKSFFIVYSAMSFFTSLARPKRILSSVISLTQTKFTGFFFFFF